METNNYVYVSEVDYDIFDQDILGLEDFTIIGNLEAYRKLDGLSTPIDTVIDYLISSKSKGATHVVVDIGDWDTQIQTLNLRPASEQEIEEYVCALTKKRNDATSKQIRLLQARIDKLHQQLDNSNPN